MLNSFGHVLKRFLSAHLMQVKLLLFTFIWMADYRKTVWMDFKFLYGSVVKTESEPNFRFPHLPSRNTTTVSFKSLVWTDPLQTALWKFTNSADLQVDFVSLIVWS